MQNWNLPENFSDILPPQTARIELARGRLLKLFRSFGYQQVVPPLVEYAEALRLGEDRALDLKTFKFSDVSGRQLALRSDITVQVARIDAHLLSRNRGINRLCYVGSVVTSRADNFSATRQPMQIGAELYGSYSIQADLEIVELMLRSLEMITGRGDLILDLGHLAVYRQLCKDADLRDEDSESLLSVLQTKNFDLIDSELDRIKPLNREAFKFISGFCGYIDQSDIDRAILELPESVSVYLRSLRELILRIMDFFPRIEIFIDLSELRGLSHYHTGLIFTAYGRDSKFILARGGRYDGIGADFGRIRPATGFSIDLRSFDLSDPEKEEVLYINSEDIVKRRDEISALRKKCTVISVFDNP